MYVRWLLEIYGIEFQSKKKEKMTTHEQTPAAHMLIESHFSQPGLRHSNFTEKAA